MDHNKSIICRPYKGASELIDDLRSIIQNTYSDLFHSVIVHGSVATNENIAYSDFDGLLIVKDPFKDSKDLRSFRRVTMKRIYEFDPLQHHGWFVLFESELKNYPQTYFPHELFEYSRTIYPLDGCEFNIQLKEDYNYLAPFQSLCDSIQKKIEDRRPKNMYYLKGILSQFMLLPALYCQARDQRGMFKKFSFESAKEDFSKEEWGIMNRVSEIRLNWHYDIKRVQKKVLTLSNPYLRRFFVPIFAPAIPRDIKQELTDDFYHQMKRLTNSIKKKIDASL